jgi:hypothetical protein
MAIFFIASGPVLALLARHTQWSAQRNQISLRNQLESHALPSNTTASFGCRCEFKPKPRFGGDRQPDP